MSNRAALVVSRDIDPVDAAFGATLRRHRQAKGLSLERLGSATGVTYQQVQKYETGANRVSFPQILRIAGVLGLRPGDLVDQAAGLSDQPGAAPTADVGFLRLGHALAALPPHARAAALRSCEAVAAAIASAVQEADETR